MPLWLLVLVCLPVALWLAYCLLRWSWGLPFCFHCALSLLGAPGALGLWMMWSGWSAEIMPRFVIGATISACTLVVAGVVFLLFRFGRRSRQAQRVDAVDAAVLGTSLVAAPLVVGPKRKDGEGDTTRDEPSAIDGDIGGMDV